MTKGRWRLLDYLGIGVFGHWLLLGPAVASPADSKAVEFNRDIRPILSDKCFTCHGPDPSQRMSKLRLDTKAGAFADLEGKSAIVPGKPARSEMYRRISSSDPAVKMPPAFSGRTLTAPEIELIRRWIEQGAKWQTQHWSFIPPRPPALPQVHTRSWPRGAIDFFVLDRLERDGLRPSPEADKATLIRRVSLDLTGLPPTPDEIDGFLQDPSPNAYEKVVDRLLQSPRYGERMATRWLDAARYADTNGYQTDGERSMWRWRDWVIDAFNRNMPFDQFTIEQIAGDMLSNPTQEQRIATGFNRNHRGNGEGGIIPEEYAVEYVVDRLETTSTVWLGLTLGCARCHDHKYDPFTQKDFYRLFAYFNNIPEKGRANKYGNSAPIIKAPTDAQKAQVQELERKLEAAEKKFAKLETAMAEAQRSWEKEFARTSAVDWSIARGLEVHYRLDGDLGGKPDCALPQEGEPAFVTGRVGQAASFDGKHFLDVGDIAGFGFYDKFTLAAWVYPTAAQGAIVANAEDVSEPRGYGLYLKEGKVQLNLVSRWLDDSLRVQTEGALELNRWHHVLATYDASHVADGVRIYVDGEPQKLEVLLDELSQGFHFPGHRLRIGAGGGLENRFRGHVDDVRVYNVVLRPDEAAVVATSSSIAEILALPGEKRSRLQSEKIKLYFLEEQAPAEIRQAWVQVRDLRAQKQKFLESIPTVMVMQESETPRPTHLLIRGAYDRPGERVSPGVPGVVAPLPQGWENNRLGLARWLVHPSNPLTARVVVNRFWQMYFGTGLVKTAENFGLQGEWPTHPELLDWLAAEFVQTGWNVKAMQKLIVSSATYRQSSQVTPELLQKDPGNRLLARGPRLRLSAGMVRDQALAIAGLMVEKIGGPSVKPYQPAGLWKELSGDEYKPDKGESLYRRSLYTFWKRTIPPPSMMVFDAAARETCIVLETRTNTPLQALNLMNDVTYLEAARLLAERMLTEGGGTPEERIGYAFRLATARWPSRRRAEILLGSFRYYLEQYRADPEAALKLLSIGESSRNEKLNASELAAYTAVASLILNLDETVTKQ